MTEISIYLAGVPLAKQRVRVTKSGHAYTPERTVNYEARLAYAAQQVMQERGLAPLTGPLSVRVTVDVPIPASKPAKWKRLAETGQVYPTKKPDIDNYEKMLDALNLIAWEDDAQIVDLRGVKRYSMTPGLLVEILAL